MNILKFGGTSVGTPQSVKAVIQIILSRRDVKGIVVSAFSKVTDQLIKMAELGAHGDESYKVLLAELETRHIDAVKALLNVKNQSRVLANIKVLINELEDILRGVFFIKECSPRVFDLIMSFGERLSAYIICEAVKDCGRIVQFLDARSLVKTDDSFGSARVKPEETYKNIKHYFSKCKTLQIITGFIASARNNDTTTLGRGGSDYTASLFGAALGASVIEIWTDVSGVMTADPRKVKKAFPVPSMTYEEAMEMSYFGAKVIHPPTMQPALEKNIPILIKNTFQPDACGTIIGEKSLNVFLVGVGLIGGMLLKQINEQQEILRKRNNIDVKIAALANSRRMLFDENGIFIEQWRKRLDGSKEKTDIDAFARKMKKLNLPNSVFVDCTADDYVASRYEKILKSHISIVTPNKKANFGKIEYYKKLHGVANQYGVKFLYETNVGAGLPIIGTLNDLISTGDKIIKIEAVLSGTLSYIFNSFASEKKRFSEIVKEARQNGFTEPDPRDDLSGMDIGRKLLILGREIGMNFEFEDIKIESLLSKKCKSARGAEDFLKKLREEDALFEKKKNLALKQGCVLRYIATLAKGKAEVALKTVGRDHPFYSMSGSDNIISFTTDRYNKTPLVIKCPGAGSAVTAAGVFADIIRISNYLM